MKENKIYIIILLLILGTFTLLTYYNIYLKERYLGNVIAEITIAESPGFEVLKIYNNNKCTVSLGGIFGISDVFYADYILYNDTIFLLTKNKIFEIINHKIEINGKSYIIREKY